MFATAFRPRQETNTVVQVPLSQIIPCPYQPRKLINRQALDDLAENIRKTAFSSLSLPPDWRTAAIS